MRKLRIVAVVFGLLGLAAALAPASAGAHDIAGTVVFTGDAAVDEGLCAPMVPCGGAAQPSTQDWSFDVPGEGDVSECVGVGVLGGDPLVDLACAIDFDGTLGATTTGALGPACGASEGNSTAGDPDTFTVGGIQHTGYVEWDTSVGGLLILNGHIADGDGHTHDFTGAVNARPTPSAVGQVPCVTEPADTFTIVGVVALP